jgi:hypothetical protein
MGMGKKLQQWLNLQISIHGNLHAAMYAYDINDCYGMAYHTVNTGKDSPTLRRALRNKHGITFRRDRTRMVIDCPPELRAKFDEQRGENTRREWLERLILLADGVGELEA